ncbi:MAG: PAS domain S-box protein [SAR324 cluster bacterium]|nr:PAS domain S-box protein [SAR324 cluster bacterium]
MKNKLLLCVLVFNVTLLEIFVFEYAQFLASSFLSDLNIRVLLGSLIGILNTSLLFYLYRHYERLHDALRQSNNDLRQEHQTRQRTEKTLNHILSVTTEGYIHLDLSSHIIEVNPSVSTILGVPMDSLLHQSLFNFIEDGPAEDAMLHQLDLLKLGRKCNFEIELVHDQKFKVSCLFHANPLISEKGDFIGFFAMITDISKQKHIEKSLRSNKADLEQEVGKKLQELQTMNQQLQEEIAERKKTETALRESEEHYRLVTEAATDAFVTFDESGKILFVNHVTENLFGYSTEELLGMPVMRLLMDLSEIHHLLEGLYVRNEIIPYNSKEITGVHKSRVEIPLEVSLGVSYKSNHPLFTGIFRNIKNRKEVEKELIELATAVEQAAETIVITDVDGNIKYANPAFEQSSGYFRHDVLGKNPRILKSGRHDQAFYQKMWSKILTGDVWRGRITNRKKSGMLYEEEMTISPIRNELGLITNFVGVKRDITHEIELEQQVRQSQKMQAIGTLAGGIAHDFNNILYAMMGYTEMTRDDLPPDSKLAGYLDQVLLAGKRAKDLVQQILTFSRQSQEEIHEVMVMPILKETLKFLRATLPTTIRIDQQLDLQNGQVMADPTHLHQIIMNLCTNSAYAMREKDGVLSIKLEQTEIDSTNKNLIPLSVGKYLKLTVQDTGTGMSREVKDRIFEPFFTTKPVGEGTGMGLSVVHGLVQKYKGYISVDSQEGRGTSISVFLPLIEKGSEQPVIPKDRLNHKGHGRILLVDDESSLLELILKILKRMGYEVTATSQSLKALEIFSDSPEAFDLIVTDHTMPHLTGVQLAQKIHQIRADIPIILTTGYHSSAHIVTDQQDIHAILQKPVDRNLLGQTIQRCLNSQNKQTLQNK